MLTISADIYSIQEGSKITIDGNTFVVIDKDLEPPNIIVVCWYLIMSFIVMLFNLLCSEKSEVEYAGRSCVILLTYRLMRKMHDEFA